MGCVVNGPGEAREADVGIAGGRGEGLIFRKGVVIRKVPEAKLVDELMKEIETFKGIQIDIISNLYRRGYHARNRILAPTLREVPAEAEVVSCQLRPGYQATAAGAYLLLALRVLKNQTGPGRNGPPGRRNPGAHYPTGRALAGIRPLGCLRTGTFRLKDNERSFALGPAHEKL